MGIIESYLKLPEGAKLAIPMAVGAVAGAAAAYLWKDREVKELAEYAADLEEEIEAWKVLDKQSKDVVNSLEKPDIFSVGEETSVDVDLEVTIEDEDGPDEKQEPDDAHGRFEVVSIEDLAGEDVSTATYFAEDEILAGWDESLEEIDMSDMGNLEAILTWKASEGSTGEYLHDTMGGSYIEVVISYGNYLEALAEAEKAEYDNVISMGGYSG